MPVQSKRRFRYLRFTGPVELIHNVGGQQERRIVTEVDAANGWLITANSGWIQIRIWRAGRFGDHGGGWVERSCIAKAVLYEYPDGTVIEEDHPDDLYPERYG